MAERYDAGEKQLFTEQDLRDAQKIVADELTRNELWKWIAKRTATERKKVLNLQLEINLNWKKLLKLSIEEVFAIAILFVKKKNHNYFSTVQQIKIKEERNEQRKNKKRRMNQHQACMLFMHEFHQLKQDGVSTKNAIEVLYKNHRSEFWGQKPTDKVMRKYYLDWRIKNRLADKASLSLPRSNEKNIAIAQEPPGAVPAPAVENAVLDVFKKIAEHVELSETNLHVENEKSVADI